MTAGRLKVWNDDAGEWEYVNGLGGSQSVRLVGPVTVGYADLPNDGSVFDLFTPTAGDFVIESWVDIEHGTPWNSSGFTCAVGQPVSVYGTTNWWNDDLTVEALEGSTSQITRDQVTVNGVLTQTPQVKLTATPIQIQIQNGMNDAAAVGATAGSIDLYFLIGTPTAP